MYDFNKYIDRNNTNSEKYDFAKDFNMPEGLLPFWVADMDFPTARPIIDAIIKRAEHGIFGYSLPYESYYEAVKSWYKNKFNFEIESDWVLTTPGVVFALSTAIRGLTKEGESVMIQTPVYYPFKKMILQNNRKLVTNSLVYDNGLYKMDMVDFENNIIENQVKMFILCSPQNPVGRVWTKEELQQVADICKKYNVIVVSDEIHSDFVRKGHTHTVFQTLEGVSDMTITCTSPSKTFNLAGVQISNIIIKNEKIRQDFKRAYDLTGYEEPNIFGIVACEAAYRYGDEWLNELKTYLELNLEKTKKFLSVNLPKVKLIEPQGTYLIWLDFSEYGLKQEELNDIIVNKAKLWLDEGMMFGIEGYNFQRINIACPWSTLEKGLENLKMAFDNK